MDLYDRTAYKFEGGLERYTTSFLISPEWVGYLHSAYVKDIQNEKNMC